MTCARALTDALRQSIPEPVPWHGDAVHSDWSLRAACRSMDTELFFARTPTEAARWACLGCPVRAECLGFALTFTAAEIVGFWGGTTPAERLRLRRAARKVDGHDSFATVEGEFG